jgi:hypothetical protein
VPANLFRRLYASQRLFNHRKLEGPSSRGSTTIFTTINPTSTFVSYSTSGTITATVIVATSTQTITSTTATVTTTSRSMTSSASTSSITSIASSVGTYVGSLKVNLNLGTYKTVNVIVEILQGSRVLQTRTVTLTWLQRTSSITFSNLPIGNLTVRIRGYSIQTQTGTVTPPPDGQTVYFNIL